MLCEKMEGCFMIWGNGIVGDILGKGGEKIWEKGSWYHY